MFLIVTQNSQENTCARVTEKIKHRLRPAALLNRRFRHRCFPVNFVKFSRTPFLQNTSGCLPIDTRCRFKSKDISALKGPSVSTELTVANEF